jgi:hypothetical protein
MHVQLGFKLETIPAALTFRCRHCVVMVTSTTSAFAEFPVLVVGCRNRSARCKGLRRKPQLRPASSRNYSRR